MDIWEGSDMHCSAAMYVREKERIAKAAKRLESEKSSFKRLADKVEL